MIDLLIATHNAGKLREYQRLLAELPVLLRSPHEVGTSLDVPEDGTTFTENASKKAKAHAEASGLLTLADDSGLEVDALDGAPGIRSARYVRGSDADRVRALLDHLRDVELDQRTARFRCLVAIATPDGRLETVEGTCEGVIAFEPAGHGGFGYDPVFYLPELGCTMAELDAEEKNRISHRARATQAAIPVLRRLIAG
ncbi:MAG: RdgB/HAM1 family non-canonical purine NTP pyrophosphatase [Anaerolineales bacterium]|nr:MAG: RdgB/HAM1 family non-canonical purine NTP pyrophosphatase [Anaerolineales bacterium]